LSRQSLEERAMANIIDLRSKRSDGRRRQPLVISASIVLLAAVVLICAGLIAVPLWTALFQNWRAEAISDP
jgi:hypothetical protein